MIRFLVLVIAIALLYYSLKYTVGNPERSLAYNKNKYILWFSIILVFAINFVILFYGYRIPGSILERNSYETMLYVRLYPGNQETKSYKVPALVERFSESDCWGDDECYSYKGYRIHYAVMPNRGTINFEDDYAIVELNKRINTSDTQDREWGVELTNEPVR